MVNSARYLSADEAASLLGIQVASLYAYVSRGLLRSEPSPDNPRSRRYLAEDVSRLQRRQAARRDPAQDIEPPLAWGVPVLDSDITLLDETGFYYRGHDVTRLATSVSIEQAARLLWTGDLGKRVQFPTLTGSDVGLHDDIRSTAGNEDTVNLLLTLLPRLAAADFGAYDLRQETVVRQGAAILHHSVALVSDSGTKNDQIAARLQQRWTPDQPGMARLLDAAMVLCADHELNASSFTVRCIASTRAPLYAALAGGLAALSGVKHGGASLAVEAMVDEINRYGNVQRVLADRLRRGEPLPGFGHRIYPHGDPRAATLMTLLEEIAPDSDTASLAREVTAAAHEITGEWPNLEFALVMLAGVLGAPRGTALTVMALGRMTGWIAHALEEYRRDELIRPRARYTGPLPH